MEKVAEPTLLTDQVFVAIRASILSGELPAGHRLGIRDLAERVGTSHMPVREAIKRLEEAGLAERVPHKGAVVKALTRQELLHVYDVRRVLEKEAARQGVAAVTSADIEHMHVEYRRMRRAIADNEPLATLDHDEAFLCVLYQAGGNPVLMNAIKGLWGQCRFYKIVGARVALQDGEHSTLWRFQAELLQAARGRDPDLAAELTSASLSEAASRIRSQLESTD